MALRWLISPKWSTAANDFFTYQRLNWNGTFSVQTSGGPWSGKNYFRAAALGGSRASMRNLPALDPPAGPTVKCGVRVRFNAAGDGQIMFTSTGTQQFNVGFNVATGVISINRSGTNLANSAAGKVLDGIWHWVEIEGVIHDSAGWVKVFLDSNPVPVVEVSAADTKGHGSVDTYDTMDVGTAGSGSGKSVDAVDWYVDDATLHGDVSIDAYVPTSDDAVDFARSTGSFNYGCVDETAISTADFVYGGVDDIDLYGWAGSPADQGDVIAAQVVAVLQKDDAGGRTGRLVMKSGSTVGNGATINLTTSPIAYPAIFALDPDGSVGWLKSTIDAAKFGVECDG